MALRCWKGYKPNPDGRPAEEDGSCVPIEQQAYSPAQMTNSQYDKKNAKMRKDHKGKLNKQKTKGKSGERISFACRFGKNPHPMKAKDGTPSGYAHSLKRWGFASPEAAKSFCDKNKKK